MEDRDFFDTMYQGWSKTTGAESTFWMPEADEEAPNSYSIVAVGADESRKHIASFLSEEDSSFITAVHGCFADLVRRLHMALDEADSADLKKDERECRIAELELEVDELKARLGE